MSRIGAARLAGLALVVAACSDGEPPASPEPCGGPGIICRVAGTGVSAYNGDGKPARETAFYFPSALRLGPDGLVHIMDFNNMRLRRIDDDGTVSTVAGNGIHAVADESSPALESPLENPVDFVFDGQGGIILVSIHDPRVLTVTPSGELDVLAGLGLIGDFGDGGDALGAAFGEIWGVARAPDGSIYVTDRIAHRVRVIHPDGTIDAFAGTGVEGFAGDGGPATEALLSAPEGIAVDDAGNVYVADAGNHTVRRIDPAGTIETVAGTGESGFSGDGGPANAAELSSPAGVTPAGGELYIADALNHRIRKVDASGVIETIAGSGTNGLAGDGGPAQEADLSGPARILVHDGQLVFSDQRNSCVRTFELAQ